MPSQRNHRSKKKNMQHKKKGEHFFVGWWILKESFEKSVDFCYVFFYPGSWVGEINQRFPNLRLQEQQQSLGRDTKKVLEVRLGGKLLETVRRCDGIMTGRYRYESSMEDTGRDCCSVFKAIR